MEKWIKFAVLTLLVLTVSAPAQDDDDAAKKLYRRYLELRTKDDYRNAKFKIIRSLGGIDSEFSRKVLLQILKSTRSLDERVIACHSLGNVADLDSAQDWLKQMEKRREAPLYQAYADGLGSVTDPAARAWLAGDAFQTRKPDVLWALARAQIAIRDPAAVPALVDLYGKSAGKAGAAPTAAAAVRALGAIGGDKAAAVVLEAAAHEEHLIQRAAATAIPLFMPASEKLDAALRILLEGGSTQTRRAAFRAIAEGKREAFIPMLIDALEDDPRARNRQAAFLALKAISGQDFSHDAAAWRLWWKDKLSNHEPTEKYTYARYYGFGVHSDRVIFVVDVSGSMQWSYHFKPKRIEVARRELKAALENLGRRSLFNVVVYSTRVVAWQRREIEVTPANVAKALRWSEKMLAEPEGDTHAYSALEKVFRDNPAFDTVFFLSDGWPSHGDYISTEGIIAAVKTWNRERDAVVHTIALTLENVDRGHPQSSTAKLREMQDFLRRLAAATGGKCKVVTSAPR